MDTDICGRGEAGVLSGPNVSGWRHRLNKLFMATFHLAFYALRPCLTMSSKLLQLDSWWMFNTSLVIASDILVYSYLGGARALLYLFLSTALAGSLHPCAGHFLAEHYVLPEAPAETYSYYGWLNIFSYNVGYHNEHHNHNYDYNHNYNYNHNCNYNHNYNYDYNYDHDYHYENDYDYENAYDYNYNYNYNVNYDHDYDHD